MINLCKQNANWAMLCYTCTSNCSIFRAKKFKAKNTMKKAERKENLKKWLMRFCLNINVRKEKEDFWLNAIKAKIAFLKERHEIENKIMPAVSVHLMEALLDNWLKNNHYYCRYNNILFKASLITCNFFAMYKSSHVYNLPAASLSRTLSSQSACMWLFYKF